MELDANEKDSKTYITQVNKSCTTHVQFNVMHVNPEIYTKKNCVCGHECRKRMEKKHTQLTVVTWAFDFI